jgi:predicted dehydrogenase
MESKMAESRIRIGFVGAGWMGNEQLKRLAARKDAEIVALCEPNAQRGQQVLAEIGLHSTRLVSDFNEIINDTTIEAVWLVSPNDRHGPQSIATLEAGKHVFSEKPASITYDDHLRQVALARSNPHLRTFVDYILYFDTFEQRLKQMVSDGAFGKVTQIQVNYRHPINIAGDKAWKLKRDVMGDAISMGINHAVSVVLFAMASQARPVKVYATSMPAQVRPFEADPIWNLHITFDNGACGLIFGDIDSGNGYDAYHNIKGAEGGLVFDSQSDRTRKVRYWNQRLTQGQWIYPLDTEGCKADGAEPWPADTTTPDSGNVIEHQTGAVVAHFIDCIRTGRPSPLSFDRCAVVAEVGWAAQVSAITGQAIDLVHGSMLPEMARWARAEAK